MVYNEMGNSTYISSVESESSNRFSQLRFRTTLQHVGLLFILMCYTGFGGWVFRHLELPAEIIRLEYFNKTLLSKRTYFVTSIVRKSRQRNLTKFIYNELEGYERLLTTAITSGYPTAKDEDEAEKENWTYLKAVFFSSTVLTTIGYGNIVPVTIEGRIFCIVYALVGIPLTLTVIAEWGRLFASLFSAFVRQICPSVSNEATSAKRRSYVFLSVCFLFVYLSAGAALFVLWEEDWSFTDGFYFCFITMTTIGFGDLVPKKPKYMLVCTVYILVGLALTSTIIELVRRQYAKSWQHIQALKGPLAQNFRKIAENAPGLDTIAFQQDLMKILAAVTKHKKSEEQPWNGDWECAFDLVMKHSTSANYKPHIVQIVIYESSV